MFHSQVYSSNHRIVLRFFVGRSQASVVVVVVAVVVAVAVVVVVFFSLAIHTALPLLAQALDISNNIVSGKNTSTKFNVQLKTYILHLVAVRLKNHRKHTTPEQKD